MNKDKSHVRKYIASWVFLLTTTFETQARQRREGFCLLFLDLMLAVRLHGVRFLTVPSCLSTTPQLGFCLGCKHMNMEVFACCVFFLFQREKSSQKHRPDK